MKRKERRTRSFEIVRTIVIAALLLSAPLGVIGGVRSASAAPGGPVVLTGIDAEDCGPGDHGPIANYVTLVSSILGDTANGGNGIIVIGANGAGPKAFWNAIGSGTGETVTFGTENSSFSGYRMVAIVGSFPETCTGLTQAQNNVLATRQQDFADFINGGGGLLGNTQANFVNQYAYLGAVGGFASTSITYSNIDPTPAGTAVGVTNALDVCCWHNVFTQFPDFLEVLAYRAGTTQAAAIGGSKVVVSVGIDLSPTSAENPVGTTHEVTASVVDSEGDPQSQVLVQFRVVSGPNAGAQSDFGECTVQPDCTTDANGQVSWSYGSNGQTGTDDIEACFSNPRTQQATCARATKTWTAPLITIDDVAVLEGDAGTTPAVFTVSLSSATNVPVQLDYATADDTATAGIDYVATAGTLFFASGDTSETITVEVVGDVINESDETFVVNLSNASNAQIADSQGLGTIIDDDRNGVFTCRASALRLGSTETIVANPDNNPCVDDGDALASADQAAGGLDARAKVLHVTTDQTPDDLESTDPAIGDNAVAEAGVAEVRISSGPHTIEARTVVSRAKVECVPSDTGELAPRLSSSSIITSLTINGLAVNVNGSATLSLGGLTLHLNEQVMAPDSVTQRAMRLSGPGIPTLVVAEAVADFRGNPCTQ